MQVSQATNRNLTTDFRQQDAPDQDQVDQRCLTSAERLSAVSGTLDQGQGGKLGAGTEGNIGASVGAAALQNLVLSTSLGIGSEGNAVNTLQENLETLGIDTSGVDGMFGPKTLRAVQGFQQNRIDALSGLLVLGFQPENIQAQIREQIAGLQAEQDTDIAGEMTLSQLDAAVEGVEETRPVGVSDEQVQAIVDSVLADIRRAHPSVAEDVEHILGVAQEQKLTPEQTAYVLATATHESNLGFYREEIASGEAYEGRADLGNTEPGDGVRFKGRGYVQITGRRNYADWSQRLGIDLLSNPELAADPDIAAQILVIGMKEGTFTGRGLDDYINKAGTDFVNARRIVNGTDKANLFAERATAYNDALASVDSSSDTQSPSPTSPSTPGVSQITVGEEGSNEPLWAKSTADIVGLNSVVTSTFDDIVAAWDANDGPTPVITSGNDGRHSTGSLHYSDHAIDLRANNISDSKAQAIADDLQSALGSDYEVIFERFPGNSSNDHIHLEYDPD